MSNRSNLTKKKKFKPYLLKDVKSSSDRKLFTVMSTFAGGGGSSTGYKLAGGNVLVANEFIPVAVQSYRDNFPGTTVLEMDIRQITRKGNKDQIMKFLGQYGIKYRELDIFDGSPPCTTFSTATSGKGVDKIEKKNVKHSDTTQSRIGMLIHDYVMLVNCIQPKVCIMENVVPSMKSIVFKDGISRLKEHGYIVQWKSVSASDCGVAQSRRRLITIGVRPDIAKQIGIKSPTDLDHLYPQPISDPLTVGDALNELQVNPHERDVLLRNCRLNSSYEVLKLIPKNPQKHMKIQDIDREWIKFNSDFTLLRSSMFTPSPTLTCRGQKMGISGVHHPLEDRKFTINEMKRLTSLPDDFKLSGTFDQKAERIGNMVPPLMIKTIAENVYLHILSK